MGVFFGRLNNLIIFSGKPSVFGESSDLLNMNEGMNLFLKNLDITFRREQETQRPRINKEESYLDKKQKSAGKYFY